MAEIRGGKAGRRTSWAGRVQADSCVPA